MVVIGQQGPVPARDPVQIHQLGQAPRVLGRQHLGPAQDIERAQRHIARRPDRGRHQVQPGLQRPGGRRPAHLAIRLLATRTA